MAVVLLAFTEGLQWDEAKHFQRSVGAEKLHHVPVE